MRFQKGHLGYWKGKKRSPITAETRKRMSIGQKGKIISDETKKKLSEIAKTLKYRPPFVGKGKNNHNWRGGTTKINQLIRTSKRYRLWRKAVFKRDNYTCVWCGARSGKGKIVILHADHIKPFAYFPKLRFKLENGRTLCEQCHKKTDTYAKQNKIIKLAGAEL